MIRPFAASSIALALIALAAPVQASTISLSGTLAGDSTNTPTGTPDVFVQNFTDDGIDVTYGIFTAQSHSTLDFSNPPQILISDGAFTEVFAQGKLFGTSSGNGTATGQGTATVTLDLVFTGGTGLFAGFTGEGTATETITRNSPTTESLTGNYTGELTSAVPEPSTWAMLLLGFAGLGLLTCQRKSKPGLIAT